MSISRREFIVATTGAAAGLILPSFYERVLSFVDRTGEPLIEAPSNAEIELIAYDWGGKSYELNLGDPEAGPPEMTWGEYIEWYFGGTPEEYLEWSGDDPVELESPAPDWMVLESWSRQDSPNALAYQLLDELDIGCTLGHGDAAGEVWFIDGPCPGNDYLGVEVPDEISLSLLQKRLNELETGIRLVMG